MSMTPDIEMFLHRKAEELKEINSFDPSDYDKADIKRGLRNADGTGVIAGLSHICNVQGYYIQDGERMPMPGRLTYRGINVKKLAQSFIDENRFGYEETAYLLLFGELPTRSELEEFKACLTDFRMLPNRFTEDMILAAPSRNIMNKLQRSVLAMYSYDDDPEPGSVEGELRQSLQLISRTPTIIAHAFAAKKHYYDNDSLYLHRPQDDLSLAENFLYAMRHDKRFTELEARLLDICLVLHMDHGGGNNSAFACRVLASTGTDLYSSISAAVGSLKGARHGGASNRVQEMFKCIKAGVSDWSDDEEVTRFLEKISLGEAGDGSGLIYGIGHAIYTMSDPRADVLKKMARSLAEQNGMTKELDLLETVERLAPDVINRASGEKRVMCANVDFYSGFVYRMLDIPEEFYTPLFAMARMVGWCAHRIEEAYNPGRIIRPAYKVISASKTFVPIAERK
ncbi:MAG: citrate synthase [Oscillospiraceae bacterium]|nr:citrate synthase [Oscillospiraceae bacterium]